MVTDSIDPHELIRLFHPTVSDWGTFKLSDASLAPEIVQRLLIHNRHMTEALEMFHGSPVSVHVLATLDEPSIYAREILLRRISDGEVVQVGVVRLDPKALSSNVLAEIRQQLAPLGRILIDRGVLRHVRFDRLYRVDLSRKSQESCYLAGECSLWGRTARIHVHGHAVIDLLEIAVLPGQ